MHSNIMMHVNRFFWQGGVPMFIYDLMSIYPEFHHVVCYLHTDVRFGGENFDMMHDWMNRFGCEVAHIPMLSENLFKEINPAITFLHSIDTRYFVNKNTTWLKRWPTIEVHHAKLGNPPATDANMFVSNFVLNQYAKVGANVGLRNSFVCPPAVNLSSYLAIPRADTNIRCVIGKVCSAWNKKKYPEKLFSIMRKLAAEYPNIAFNVVGAEYHFKLAELNVPRLSAIKEMSMPVSDMLKQMDIFLYVNEEGFPETWCRAVSEAMAAGIPVVVDNFAGTAEQVADGIGGFACGTEDEFISKLKLLIEDPRLRYDIGMAGRRKATQLFGLDRLRRETEPWVMQAMTGVI